MPEHEAPEFARCAVCGRTMLRGERLWDYVSASGEPHRVCALCKSQAEAAGWLPRELAAAPTSGEERPSRTRMLRERIGRVAESAKDRAGGQTPAKGSDPEQDPEHASPRRRRLFVEREPAPNGAHGTGGQTPGGAGDRYGPGPGSDPGFEHDPQRLARRAADRFNASEAHRTVAGLTRSLGEPQASIEISKPAGDATVTVAWELSWYQWKIDPGEHGAVREVRKGSELEELSDAEPEWNARVGDDGSLRPASA